MSDEPVRCFNKGCAKMFKLSMNNEKSCRFHPGGPIFHDALKGWSCCKKRSTDFTDFLSIPGCTFGCHNNVLPKAEEEKPKSDPEVNNLENNVITVPKTTQPIIQSSLPRPPSSEPLCELPHSVLPSLKKVLEDQIEKLKLNDGNIVHNKEESEIQLGTKCKNKGCPSVYEANIDMTRCVHHPGVPIFHEGMKYWSCCTKKTSDFTNFLEQEGCATGEHVWVSAKESEECEVKNCRFDWHQTEKFVTVSVYAKCAVPELSVIMANQVKLQVSVTKYDDHLNQSCVFQDTFNLFNCIDLEKSSVRYAQTKVEITLKKMENFGWRSLTN